VTPGWPDDPGTVTQAREHPEVFAGKGVGGVGDVGDVAQLSLDFISRSVR
jgi:hypothetical protein